MRIRGKQYYQDSKTVQSGTINRSSHMEHRLRIYKPRFIATSWLLDASKHGKLVIWWDSRHENIGLVLKGGRR